MIDDLIQKAAHLPWLVGRLNQIKGRFDAEFHAYFVKDLLRDLMSEVDNKIPSVAADYRVGIAFLQFERITCATRADDEIFDRRVNELMGRLRLAS
jgi:hypothetical protein